jgi:hypothetical protein
LVHDDDDDDDDGDDGGRTEDGVMTIFVEAKLNWEMIRN